MDWDLDETIRTDTTIKEIQNEISELQDKLEERIKEIREEFANEKVRDWWIRRDFFGSEKMARKINKNITFSELFENSRENDYVCQSQRLGIRDLKEFKPGHEFMYFGFINACRYHYFKEIKDEPFFTCDGELMNKVFENHGSIHWDEVGHTYENGKIYYIFKSPDIDRQLYIITRSDYEEIGQIYLIEIEDSLESIGIKEEIEKYIRRYCDNE